MMPASHPSAMYPGSVYKDPVASGDAILLISSAGYGIAAFDGIEDLST